MLPVFIKKSDSGRERVHALDIIRGALILGMIVDHAVYDCTAYLGIFPGAMEHPVRLAFHYIGAYLFVMMSGASSSISRNNLKRGFMLLGAALAVTLVTLIFDRNSIIIFGILHCLALCILIYALARPLLEKIPNTLAPFIWIVLAAVFKYLTDTVRVESGWFWLFGFRTKSFFSADYYPLFPWLFVFFLGAWCGPYIFGHKLPEWFYKMRCGFLEKVGRWSLWIYLIHQPVVMFVVLVIKEMYFRT